MVVVTEDYALASGQRVVYTLLGYIHGVRLVWTPQVYDHRSLTFRLV